MPPARSHRIGALPSAILDRPRYTLLLFFGLTLLATFPLALSWRTSLPAGSGDLWQNYWNFWWWKKCLLEGLNPLHAPVLFHPGGTDLVFHTHSPFNQILAMPVNLLFGEAAAYNFCLVLALTLSGFGTYLLVRALTGSAAAGFIAGTVFAYFPQTVEQTLEHLNLFSVQFIPLSLFFLLKWSRSARTCDALAFGACFGLNALCSWHLGLKLALVAVPWAIWTAWRAGPQRPRALRDLAAAAALATLLALPFLAPMLALIGSGSEYYLKGAVNRGIDASYLFTPTYANPVGGPLVHGRFMSRAYQASGFVCYLGFLPTVLAWLALRRRTREALAWGLVFAAGLVLSLGAKLWWDGSLYNPFPLPFSALGWLPFLENLRVANRFLLLAGLALAVLAGYGWTALRHRPAWALPLAAAVILVEYSWMPFPTQQVDTSPLLAGVASRPGAVLDIPFHQRSRTVHNMVAQTVHGRPISGGYLSSYPPEIEERIRGEPALAQLAGNPEAAPALDIASLRQLGFRTVIIHKYRMQSYRESLQAAAGEVDLLERKRMLRLGGVPDDVVLSIRRQLDQEVGAAALEDDRLAIYFL